MFKLLDLIPDGSIKMLEDLEDYIVCTGLEDMKASKHIITQVKYIFLLHG